MCDVCGNHEAQFWQRVSKDGERGCWPWTGHITTYGYGAFYANGQRHSAHRVSFELHKGRIPEDRVIDHICRVRHCVNPDHLRLLTNVENVMIGVSPLANKARQTHCIHGHEFNEANTKWGPSGRRWCRTCNRRRSRTARAETGARTMTNTDERWTIPRDGTCTAEGCERPRSRRGLCSRHYDRKRYAAKRKAMEVA